MKQAGEAFDASSCRNAASDRFDAAENAVDTAGAARAGGRKERPTARQAHERASSNVDRLQLRVRELSERLDRMPE